MVCQEAALLTKVNLIPMASLITVLIQTFPQKKNLERLPSFNDLDLFTSNSCLDKRYGLDAHTPASKL